MKKLIYIAFAALAALTACTKVEMDSYAPQRKVTFQVASYAPQTKANSSMWTLGSSPSFTAKAFLHADGYTDETQNFFGASGETITPYKNDGTAATAETNTSYWGPSHDYYWPKSSNSYINFIAWRGATPATATETSLSWTDYTVQSTDDLVYADALQCKYNQRFTVHRRCGYFRSSDALPPRACTCCFQGQCNECDQR